MGIKFDLRLFYFTPAFSGTQLWRKRGAECISNMHAEKILNF
jgi:hypothetical protein